MDQETFENKIRQFVRSKPFHPFQVELLDGNLINIESPDLAMGGGAVTKITDQEFIEFVCEDVRDMRLAPLGMQ